MSQKVAVSADWKEIEKEYKEGEPTKRIARKYGVAPATVRRRASIGKWLKPAQIDMKLKKMELYDVFESKGLTFEKAIEEVVKGCLEPMKGRAGEERPDWEIRLKYLQEYNKMCGHYAPSKSLKGTINLGDGRTVKDLTIEQLEELEKQAADKEIAEDID